MILVGGAATKDARESDDEDDDEQRVITTDEESFCLVVAALVAFVRLLSGDRCAVNGRDVRPIEAAKLETRIVVFSTRLVLVSIEIKRSKEK